MIVKPKISRDPFCKTGYICQSKQPGLSWHSNGWASIVGTGDTIQQAYENWVKSLKQRQERYEKFKTEGGI